MFWLIKNNPGMVKKILILFLFFFGLPASAQSDVYKKKIDSLQRKLPAVKSDTTRVNILLQISDYYKELDMASEAFAHSQKAADLSKKAKWDKGLVYSYRSLAASYEYKSDFANELAYYKKALVLAKEMGDDLLVAKVYRNLAIAEMDEDINVSFRYFDAAIRLFKKLGRTDDYLEALLQKGGSYSLKGMNYEAADCFREVRDVAEKKGNTNMFMTSSKAMADIYTKRGDREKAMEMYRSLLKKAESQKVFNGYTADVYSSLASFYSEKKQHKTAIDYYNKALKIRENFGDIYGQAGALGYISSEYHALGDAANEKKYLEKAYAVNLQNPYGLTRMYAHVFFGRILFANENYEEALKNHLESLAIGEKLNAGEVTALANCNVGATYFELAKKGVANADELLDKAIFHLEKGIKVNREFKNLERISSFLYYLYQAYDLKSDFKKAFVTHKEYILYRDSLNNMEKNNQFLVKEKEYEYGKKETQLKAKQKISLENEKSLRNMSLAGAAFLIVIAGGVGVGYVRKRRDNKIIENEKKRSDDLLLNILPYEVAEELKEKGEANAKYYEQVSIIFTDFEEFTRLSEKMSPGDVISQLNYCFKAFDRIITKYNIEKIKTIGDAYMAVSGLPNPDPDHALNAVKAALEMRDFIDAYKEERKKQGEVYFEMRIGINSGEVVAGIVGIKKFAYDIWGDAVNVAARMETNGKVGKVNVSETTYNLIKNEMDGEYRGEIEVKGKGMVKMYFAEPKNATNDGI
ncbi:MAG: hypothetical protein DI539_09725 [Flavobacterium psychrophilum]|nr:MAG: hypothetical protein DI539_09725 [Flavobacterium psychrophilum]